jgi:glutamine cyclotransferase
MLFFVLFLVSACEEAQNKPAEITQTHITSTRIINTSPALLHTTPQASNPAELTPQLPELMTSTASIAGTIIPPIQISINPIIKTLESNLSGTPLSAETNTLTQDIIENADIKHFTIEVINEFPHDPQAFTEGLIFHDGYFYESTGRYGSSSLRKVVVETGEILQQYNLPVSLFAEGITIFQDQIIQLTWKSKIGFIFDMNSFNIEMIFGYNFEGWGITNDNVNLIISDGSTGTIYMLDPQSFEVIKELEVTINNQPVTNINELELINGELYANIWQTTKIAVIKPNTGEVTGCVELSGLFDRIESGYQIDTLNGIAYDEELDRLFVTGKLWPKIFEIKLVPIND